MSKPLKILLTVLMLLCLSIPLLWAPAQEADPPQAAIQHTYANELSGPIITPPRTLTTNPYLGLTAVPLDEFGQVTETLKGNIGDVVYVELRGEVLPDYYWGAVLAKVTGADIVSLEESYDWWWNGMGFWWTTASADPARGGGRRSLLL
ncbi:MAG: hypothetical protein AB1599_08785 [Planctomycetota bacterium]